jgi:ribosomal protein L7Ae-like RNA K-turn-binding protein
MKLKGDLRMNNFLTLMGFAKKAGKLITGSNAVLRSILSGNSFLVIVAKDAGESVKSKFLRLCEENTLDCIIYGNSAELSYSTGENNKVIYSIEDGGFAKKIKDIIVSS